MSYQSPENEIHISIDIETLGLTPGHKILSIGAIEMFNPPTYERSVYLEVDRKSQDRYFLIEDSDTIAWWAKQKIPMPGTSEVLREADVADAMKELSEWIADVVASKRDLLGNPELKPYIWAKSPSFDCSILKDIYRRVHEKCPWDFRQEMDVRTAMKISKLSDNDFVFTGKKHNALDDARYQAEIVERCYRYIGML